MVDVLAETDLSGNLLREYVYFGGERMARREADGTVYYLFADRLGSNGAMTDAQGAYKDIRTYYPFGGIQRWVNLGVDNRYQFAGMERDAESGLDHTLFRKYASNLGRWMTPDPLAGDILNPQSLNRYAYALNNPTNLTDPLGLDPPQGPPPHPGCGDDPTTRPASSIALHCSSWGAGCVKCSLDSNLPGRRRK